MLLFMLTHNLTAALCLHSQCQNGGTCRDQIGSYSCDCPAGFGGTDCETALDLCASTPCQNNAVCTPGIGSYMCTCVKGFVGTNCEINIDDCVGNPCGDGAIQCFDGVADYACKCKTGYEYDGTTCIDINECFPPGPFPCNDKTEACVNTDGSFSCNNCFNNNDPACDCVDGFARNAAGFCTDIDECAIGENDCLPDAECVDTSGSFHVSEHGITTD